MKRLTLFMLLSLPGILASQNNETEASARITSVTVYTAAAEIHYEQEVLLKKGKNTVVFTDLTPYIVENTVNMSISDPNVDIITVMEKINYAKDKKTYNRQVQNLRDSIKSIRMQSGLIQCKTEALEAEKTLLFREESIGGVSKGVPVSEIEKAALFFHNRYSEINTELFHQKEKQARLAKKTDRLVNQLSGLTSSSEEAISEIKVMLKSPAQKKVKFSFKFLTQRGGWAPSYDFKYQGPDKPLEFIFRANVFNACGVPWNDIDIKLSTADPIRGFDLPSLNGNKGKGKVAEQQQQVQGVEFKEVEVVNAIAEYAVSHKYTIPSNAKPYLVDINSFTLQASFNYLLIPKLDPFGFLIANIPDWNKFNLIPGTTNIYNMGTYMGKTFLNTYAENDTLNLYLGKDKSIQSIRKEKNEEHRRLIIGNNFVDETFIDISVKNNFKGPLSVEVLDQVPVFSSAEKVKFNIHNIDDAEYDKEEGLLKWKFTLNAGETKDISFKYDIKAPKGLWSEYRPKRRKFRTISCPSF